MNRHIDALMDSILYGINQISAMGKALDAFEHDLKELDDLVWQIHDAAAEVEEDELG